MMGKLTVGLVAAGTDRTVKGVAAITLYFQVGITSIIDDTIGGSPPTPIDIGAINNSITNNQIYIVCQVHQHYQLII